MTHEQLREILFKQADSGIGEKYDYFDKYSVLDAMNEVAEIYEKISEADKSNPFIEYLLKNKKENIIDFHLRIDSDRHFYIHPLNIGGDTFDMYWALNSEQNSEVSDTTVSE